MTVARRWRVVDDESSALSCHIKAILDDIAARSSPSTASARTAPGQLLVTAGDNPDRLAHYKSFAELCAGTSTSR